MSESSAWMGADYFLALGSLVVVGFIAFEGLAFKLRGPEDSFLVAQARAAFWLHAKCFFGLRVMGGSGDPIPAQGAMILVANHQSGADPVLLSLVTKRRVRFLMAREYFETKGLSWLFRAVGAIPVNRDGNDLSATKASLKALHRDQCIGVFPQGGIREGGLDFDDSKSGAALLALKTGTPILPCYIKGSPEHDSVFRVFFMPSRVEIFFGKPFLLGSGEAQRKVSRPELGAATERVLNSIVALRPTSEESEVAAKSRASPTSTVE